MTLLDPDGMEERLGAHHWDVLQAIVASDLFAAGCTCEAKVELRLLEGRHIHADYLHDKTCPAMGSGEEWSPEPRILGGQVGRA